MSDSMYAIGWLEMKEFHRAYAHFKQMFKHIAGAFQVTDWMFQIYFGSYNEQCMEHVPRGGAKK